MATEPTAGADTDTPPAEVTRTWARLTEDRGVVSDEMMAELTELALEGDDEEEEEMYNRENASTVLTPKCDRCVIYQAMLIDSLKSMQVLSAQNVQLEDLKPQCELLKKQVAESHNQIEESLKAEHTLKARAETAEAEAVQVKEKFDALEKDFDAMAKAAEEGKKHANEANVWRAKYERSLELSKKIQDKRKNEMDTFEKVLTLGNGYCKESKHLQAKIRSIKKDYDKVMKLIKTYVPVMLNVIKHAKTSPSFKSEMPPNIQLDAEKLCTGDVERAFEFDFPDHRSHGDDDDDDGMSSELERLVGGAVPSKKLVESPLAKKSSRAAPQFSKVAKTPVLHVQQPSSAVEGPEKTAALTTESVDAVMESNAPAPELVEPHIEQLGDEEADALLEAGAEAITMVAPPMPARGRGRGRGRRGRGARQDYAAQPSGSENFPLNKRYEEILASKLKRRDDVPEGLASTSNVKHMSIHGKKTMSVREQQEAQMKVSIKEKVALMKKKEAERARTLDDDNDAGDAILSTLELTGETAAQVVLKAAQEESPKKLTRGDFSLAREDLLLSASNSPASSVLEGQDEERADMVQSDMPASGPERQDEALEQPDDGRDTVSMDVAAPSEIDKSPVREQISLTEVDDSLVENLMVDGVIPLDFEDQVLVSKAAEGARKEDIVPYEEATPTCQEESTGDGNLGDEMDLLVGDGKNEDDGTMESETTKESVLSADQAAAEKSAHTSASPPSERVDTVLTEERAVMVDESETVFTEIGASSDNMERNSDEIAEKEVVLPGSAAELSEDQLVSVPCATEPHSEAGRTSESGTTKTPLADGTKRAIGFGRRLRVDLEEKLTPIKHSEDNEAATVPLPRAEKACEQLVESVTTREEGSSSHEESTSHGQEQAESLSCVVGKGSSSVETTPQKVHESSEEPSSSSSSKRQPIPRHRSSAKDRDLAMQLYAQLNPRSLRSRRGSESDSQIPENISRLKDEMSKKLGTRSARTQSESQRPFAEVKEMLKSDAATTTKKAEKSKQSEVVDVNVPEVSAAVPSKAKKESDVKEGKTDTPKKPTTSDFTDDILAGARCAPSQEKTMSKKASSPTKAAETATDFFEDILAGARSSSVSQGRIARTKKVLPSRNTGLAVEYKSRDERPSTFDSQELNRPDVSSTSDVAEEKESTENAPIQSESAPDGDSEHKLRSPLSHTSSSSESLESEFPSSSTLSVRRTRGGSVGRLPAKSAKIENVHNTDAQKDVGVSKRSAEKSKTPGKPNIDATEVITSVSAKSVAEEKKSSKRLFSPTRSTRANILKSDAAKESSQEGPPSRVSTRTRPVASRKRRIEEDVAAEALPVSRKPAEVETTTRKADDGEVAEKPSEESSSRVTRRAGLVTPRRRVEEQSATKASTKSQNSAVLRVSERVGTALTVAKSPICIGSKSTEESPSEGPPSRVTRRTGPIAPKKRRLEEEGVANSTGETDEAAPATTSLSQENVATGSETKEPNVIGGVSSLEDSDDEDRLCVAEDETSTETVQPSAPTSDITHDDREHLMIDDNHEERPVVDDDEEERLVVDEGENDNEEACAAGKEQISERTESVQEKVQDESNTISETSDQAGESVGEELSQKSSHPTRKGVTGQAKKQESSPAIAARVVATKVTTKNIGALGAAKRSVPDLKAGPAAMQKFNATLSKQLKKGRPAKKVVEKPTKTSSAAEKPVSAPPSSSKAPSTQKTSPHVAVATTPQGSKRKREGISAESVPVAKRQHFGESSVQKQLQGALLSEQKIEVIRKNLAGCLEEIANMHPEEFANAMTTCSLNLHSGDMWTIIQKNFKNCDASDIHNTKEDTFLQICRELGGSGEIWLNYVKKMMIVFSTQTPNPIYTGRYIRLFIRALRETGDLLSWEEKKDCLRTILTRIFLEDTGVAIKATTYALLTPQYELLDWMKDQDDPFTVLLSLAVTTAHMEGKVLLWAWFQQFGIELPLEDISPRTVNEAFNELLTKLDELAESRARKMGESDIVIPISVEENALIKMAIAYLSPANGSHVNLKPILADLFSDCTGRIKKAMNPRALGGENAWSEVYAIRNRSHLFIGLTRSALSYRDDLTVIHDVCNLLRSEIPSIREIRDKLATLATAEKPWLDMYSTIAGEVIAFLQALTLYEM